MKKRLGEYKRLHERTGIHIAHRQLYISAYDEDLEEEMEYEAYLDFFIWGDGRVFCFSNIEDSKDYFYWFTTETIKMENIDAEIDELINNLDEEYIQNIIDHREIDWMFIDDPNLVCRDILRLY